MVKSESLWNSNLPFGKIFNRFGTKHYRQTVGIPMVTNVADLFLFCYERDFVLFLSDENQADIIETVNILFLDT